MFIGKFQVLFPVIIGHVMPAAADVISDAADRWSVQRGLLFGRQAREPVELVNRPGVFVFDGEKYSGDDSIWLLVVGEKTNQPDYDDSYDAGSGIFKWQQQEMKGKRKIVKARRYCE